MAASDFGDGSIVGSLLHWDRYAFFLGCTALGLSGAFGAYDKLGVISHSGMEFLVFTTFLLGIFFCFVSPSCTHFFPLLYLSFIKGYLFCFSFLHSFFLLYLLFIN